MNRSPRAVRSALRMCLNAVGRLRATKARVGEARSGGGGRRWGRGPKNLIVTVFMVGAVLLMNVDTASAVGGLIDTPFNYGNNSLGADSIVYAVVRQPDGKVIIGGAIHTYNGDANASDGVMRLNVNGTLDTSFNYGSGKGTFGDVRAVALQPDGKILIGGFFQSYNGDTNASDNVLRLNPDGTLDTSFNYGAGKGAGNAVLATAGQ